jgi:hypothetical protein
MKLIERKLNEKILEARFRVSTAKRQLETSQNWIGSSFAAWVLARAEEDLDSLLALADDE